MSNCVNYKNISNNSTVFANVSGNIGKFIINSSTPVLIITQPSPNFLLYTLRLEGEQVYLQLSATIDNQGNISGFTYNHGPFDVLCTGADYLNIRIKYPGNKYPGTFYWTWNLADLKMENMSMTLYFTESFGYQSAIPPDFSQNDNTIYPKLYIIYDLTADNQSINQIDVQIIDIYSYQLVEKINYKSCLTDPFYFIIKSVNRPVSSYFSIQSPNIQSIINSCGCSLQEKLDALSSKYGDLFSSDNFVGYLILKYILSALIYNQFDLCHLSCSQNNNFLTNLELSRFNHYNILFLDPQYHMIGYNLLTK